MAHVVKMSLAVFTAVRIGNHSSTARIAFDSTHEWRGDEQKNRASVKDHHRPSGQARCWPFPGREFPVSRGFLACYEPCPSAARLPLNSAARGPWAMVERRRQFTTTRREANRQDPYQISTTDRTHARTGKILPVKRHPGEPGHRRDTRDTRPHAGTRITRTNLTTIHPNPKTQTRTKTATDRLNRDNSRKNSRKQARSRPLPAQYRYCTEQYGCPE